MDKKKTMEAVKEQKVLFENPIYSVEYFDDRFYKLQTNKDFQIPNTFNPNHVHFHEDGKDLYLPSVTTILGVQPMGFLAKWRGDIGNREADQRLLEGQIKGSIIHDLCYKLITGKTIIWRNDKTNFPTYEAIEEMGKLNEEVFLCFSQDIMIQIARFNRLLDILNPKVIEIEKTVYYLNEMFYAGTIDYIWELESGDYQISTKKGEHIEAGRYVVDLKTGNNCDDKYFLQTIAYTKCLNEEIKGNIIIHTNSDNKTGIEGIKLFIKETKDFEPYWNQFKNYYSTFQFINKDIKPKLYEIPYLLKRKDI